MQRSNWPFNLYARSYKYGAAVVGLWGHPESGVTLNCHCQLQSNNHWFALWQAMPAGMKKGIHPAFMKNTGSYSVPRNAMSFQACTVRCQITVEPMQHCVARS